VVIEDGHLLFIVDGNPDEIFIMGKQCMKSRLSNGVEHTGDGGEAITN
jgi:hypothetical protein